MSGYRRKREVKVTARLDDRQVFGRYEFDLRTGRLLRDGVLLAISPGQLLVVQQVVGHSWNEEPLRVFEHLFFDYGFPEFDDRFRERALERGYQVISLDHSPIRPLAMIGMAQACLLQFEATRTDEWPDQEPLKEALHTTRMACEEYPDLGEAWATRGIALDRSGKRRDGLEAVRRGAELNPNNFEVLFALATLTWGEERLQVTHRTGARRPDYPMCHFMAAMVHVARGDRAEAERLIDQGVSLMPRDGATRRVAFPPIALHWFKGLLCLARGELDETLRWSHEELMHRPSDHVYSREVEAESWTAIGACHLRRDNRDAARAAFNEAVQRVPLHGMARAGLETIDGVRRRTSISASRIDVAMSSAVVLVAQGEVLAAVALVFSALEAAPAGSAGWSIPIAPLLRVQDATDAWAPVLALLRTRAS